MQKIILASQSPRRQMLLEWAEVPFEVIVKHTDEVFPAGLPIEEVPEYIAMEKVKAVQEELNRWREGRTLLSQYLPILAADTIVVLDGEIIGKPESKEHAEEILMKLSGRTHEVYTGVVLVHSEQQVSFTDRTEVTFYPITPEQVRYYVEKYKPYDKAGAYAIQEWIGVIGIESIVGDFYNVMGLPISKVVKAIQSISPEIALNNRE